MKAPPKMKARNTDSENFSFFHLRASQGKKEREKEEEKEEKKKKDCPSTHPLLAFHHLSYSLGMNQLRLNGLESFLKINFKIDATMAEYKTATEIMIWCLTALLSKTMDPPRTPGYNTPQHKDWWNCAQEQRKELEATEGTTSLGKQDRVVFAATCAKISGNVSRCLSQGRLRDLCTGKLNKSPLYLSGEPALTIFIAWSLGMTVEEIHFWVISAEFGLNFRQAELNKMKEELQAIRREVDVNEVLSALSSCFCSS